MFGRDADPKRAPETLARVNWLFFRGSDDVETAFSTLIGALDTDLDHVHTHTRLLVRATEWGSGIVMPASPFAGAIWPPLNNGWPGPRIRCPSHKHDRR